jgi:hypothetical protein
VPIFNEKKVIFLHIGKTGGFSVEKALGLPPRDYRKFCPEFLFGVNKGVMVQHARLPYLEQFMTEPQKKFYKFTIIRNPWDRMVSAFYYLKPAHLKAFGSFESWLEHKHQSVVSGRWGEGSHFVPQIEYTHRNGKQIVDKIIRFENLGQEFRRMCRLNGIEASELQKLNASRLRDKRLEDYTPKTRQMVYEMYQTEIEHFGFKYG